MFVSTKEILSLEDTDIGSIIQTANDIQQKCNDYTVTNSSKKLRFHASNASITYKPDGNAPRTSKLTENSFTQLCTKIGVPYNYIEKCIDGQKKTLAEKNMNEWIGMYNKNLFVREYEDTVRGILSSRFTALDAPEVLDVVSDVVPFDNYSIKGSLITPERLHLRLIQTDKLNVDGEDLFGGIQIDSSDVGRAVLNVKFLIWKQVCSNGLCISKGGGVLFSQRHVGIDKDVFYKEFAASMSDLKPLVARAEELVRYCKSDDKYSTASLSATEMKHFVERISRQTGVSEKDMNNVLVLMNEKYDHSTWGMINSLTDIAQNYTLERRMEIENAAAKLIAA